MSNEERHRDIGEAIESLARAHAERGCLSSRLAKFRGQLEAVAGLLGTQRPAICDGELVRHGAATQGGYEFPDRQEVFRAVDQYNAAIEKYEAARQRCCDLGLNHLLQQDDDHVTWDLLGRPPEAQS